MYSKEYYKKNKKRINEQHRQYYLRNRNKIREQNSITAMNTHRELKDIIFEHYGRHCNCNKCPETNSKFLTIDYVNNDGNKDKTPMGNKRQSTTLYRHIVAMNFPDTYQILCMNCNFGKKINNGVCPHKD